MTGYEIQKQYNIDINDFAAFLRGNGLQFSNVGGLTVPNHLVDQYVANYNNARNAYYMNKAAQEQEKRAAMAKILISSGFNFDGYKIVRYSGYISGDDATQIPRSGIFGGGKNGENLTNALVRIRRQALAELKEAAYNLGCNAVIGVDFDYITLEPETANLAGGTHYEPYVICVTANGNAVVIEPLE